MENQIFICENCGKEHNGSYGSGRFCSKSCKCSFNAKKITNHVCNFHGKKSKEGGWNCPCGLNFRTKILLQIHKKECSEYIISKHGWNKGLTKETDERVRKIGEKIKNNLKTGKTKPSFLGKHHTEETKRKLKKNGGYKKGCNRFKCGYYKGYYCDSSWELAFVIYNLEHNISFERNRKTFEYNYNGEIHTYMPDFIINDIYYEIKGYINDKWYAKYNEFKKKS